MPAVFYTKIGSDARLTIGIDRNNEKSQQDTLAGSSHREPPWRRLPLTYRQDPAFTSVAYLLLICRAPTASVSW